MNSIHWPTALQLNIIPNEPLTGMKERVRPITERVVAITSLRYGLGGLFAIPCLIATIVAMPFLLLAGLYQAVVRRDTDLAGRLVQDGMSHLGCLAGVCLLNIFTLGCGFRALCACNEYHKSREPAGPRDDLPAPGDSPDSSPAVSEPLPQDSHRSLRSEQGPTIPATAVKDEEAEPQGPQQSSLLESLRRFPENRRHFFVRPVSPVDQPSVLADNPSDLPHTPIAAQLCVQPPPDLPTLGSGLRTPVAAPIGTQLRVAIDPRTPRPAAAASAAAFRGEASQPPLVISKQQEGAMDAVLQFFRDVEMTGQGIYRAKGSLEALNVHAPELKCLSGWTLLGIALSSSRWRQIIRQVQGDKSKYVDITPVLLKSEGKSVPAILKELGAVFVKSLFGKKATKYQQLLQLILPELDKPSVVNSLERDIEDIRRTFCYLTTERLERVVEIATRLLLNKGLSFGERQQAIEEILQQAYGHAEETGHQDFLQIID